MSLIPASTLPVDPTGLSYEAGEQTVDPRDQLTPGMMRITNGEDILENLTGLTGDQQRELYNNMLLDPRWFKWMLQSGVKRFAKPKYWQIGQLHQDKWPGVIENQPFFKDSSLGVRYFDSTIAMETHTVDGQGTVVSPFNYGSDPRGIFQTGHRGTLGWMPTDSLQRMTDGSGNIVDKPFLASIPEVELFKILTPPMHKTNYYYRAFITETVYFKHPIVMNVNGYRPIDVFHLSQYGLPWTPTNPNPLPSDVTYDSQTGGNDGSD